MKNRLKRLTQAELMHLVLLEKLATSPQWVMYAESENGWGHEQGDGESWIVGPLSTDERQLDHDLELLVTARNALPALLQELLELRAERA